MSGNMYENQRRRQNMSRWNSKVECGSQEDASSQLSDDIGRLSMRAPDVCQRIRGLFKSQQYTDVKFVLSCGVKPKPVLKAHRAILASGSRKFADMLYGEASREIAKDVHPEIQINNIPFEAFKNVVEYLYTDDVYFSNDPAVMETLAAARTFQVQPLVDRCESYFESAEVTEENACTRLQLATTHKMEALKSRCANFIQDNTRAVIRSQDFKSAFLATVRNICKLPKFNLRSEKELFDAVMEWAAAQSESHSSRRELIEPMLKNIRFLTMTIMEFTSIVERCPDIFNTKEALSIVVYMSNPNKNAPMSNLPSWCNKAPNRCDLFSVPNRPVMRDHIADEKVSISLRPVRKGYINNLICSLEMKCHRGNFEMRGLKLAFGDPVNEYSCIGHLSISVNLKPSEFHFTEHIKIDNSKEVVVPFSKTLFVRGGNTIHIRAEASEVKNYYFLQFDEENSFSEDSPFECSLGSVPKENRLFFIKEVMYAATQPRARNLRNFRGGKRM